MHCDGAFFKLESIAGESAKKKMEFSGLVFFLSILEAGVSAFAAVTIGTIS